VAIRADMDGLPVTEETGLSYASRHPGVMHACGHDGHMAIALGVAARAAKTREFPGTLRMLFQPAEERPPGGARALIEAGLINGVDAVFGLHLWASLPVGTVGLSPGPVMAYADEFAVAVSGRGGHGSEPEQTVDALLVAAQIVVNLQTIVSRRVSALDPVVVSCGTMTAGHAFNIIAERARIEGTVRTLSPAVQARVRDELIHIADTTARASHASAEVTYRVGYPAVVNPEQPTRRWQQALADLVTVIEPRPSLGGEDFAYYLQERPGAFLFLGCRPDRAYPHHSAHFQLDEAALPLGVEVLWRAVALPVATVLKR
jgi:amidohydrolase